MKPYTFIKVVKVRSVYHFDCVDVSNFSWFISIDRIVIEDRMLSHNHVQMVCFKLYYTFFLLVSYETKWMRYLMWDQMRVTWIFVCLSNKISERSTIDDKSPLTFGTLMCAWINQPCHSSMSWLRCVENDDIFKTEFYVLNIFVENKNLVSFHIYNGRDDDEFL